MRHFPDLRRSRARACRDRAPIQGLGGTNWNQVCPARSRHGVDQTLLRANWTGNAAEFGISEKSQVASNHPRVLASWRVSGVRGWFAVILPAATAVVVWVWFLG